MNRYFGSNFYDYVNYIFEVSFCSSVKSPYNFVSINTMISHRQKDFHNDVTLSRHSNKSSDKKGVFIKEGLINSYHTYFHNRKSVDDVI